MLPYLSNCNLHIGHKSRLNFGNQIYCTHGSASSCMCLQPISRVAASCTRLWRTQIHPGARCVVLRMQCVYVSRPLHEVYFSQFKRPHRMYLGVVVIASATVTFVNMTYLSISRCKRTTSCAMCFTQNYSSRYGVGYGWAWVLR